MGTIRLTDAAKAYKALPHQMAAWNALQQKLTPDQVSEFAELYRAAPKPKDLQPTQAVVFTPASSFSIKITPHITYGEFALNSEDRRFQYQYQCDTAVVLAQFLERVRSAFGSKPVIITSGYRPPAINRACGGATNSEHLYDRRDTGAVDFYVDGASIHRVQDFCDQYWPYSVGYGADRGFVHLGIRAGKPRVRWDY